MFHLRLNGAYYSLEKFHDLSQVGGGLLCSAPYPIECGPTLGGCKELVVLEKSDYDVSDVLFILQTSWRVEKHLMYLSYRKLQSAS